MAPDLYLVLAVEVSPPPALVLGEATAPRMQVKQAEQVQHAYYIFL